MVAARFLKLRRLCGPPSRSEQVIVLDQATTREVAHVRSGSLADICSAKGHVRFAPNSDRKSGFPQTAMSALPRFTPESGRVRCSYRCPLWAKSGHSAIYSITSSCVEDTDGDGGEMFQAVCKTWLEGTKSKSPSLQ
jgi:hypothetical protein